MTARLSFCVKAARDLQPDDLDAITASIEAYTQAGMSVKLAEAAAVDDVLAQVAAERAEWVSLAQQQHPDLFKEPAKPKAELAAAPAEATAPPAEPKPKKKAAAPKPEQPPTLQAKSLETRPFFAGTKYAEGVASPQQARADAIEVIGFDPMTPVLPESRPDRRNAPMRYSLDAKRIYYNTASPHSRGEDVQTMVEELLHAVDHVGGDRTLSASSDQFLLGGTIRGELEAARGRSAAMREFLAYPFDEPGYTDTQIAAELFARAGTLYHGFPDLLRTAAPNTFNAYEQAFGPQKRDRGVPGQVRQLPDERRLDAAQAGSQPLRSERIDRTDASSDRSGQTDGLRGVRGRVVAAFGAKPRGARVEFGEAGSALEARKPSTAIPAESAAQPQTETQAEDLDASRFQTLTAPPPGKVSAVATAAVNAIAKRFNAYEGWASLRLTAVASPTVPGTTRRDKERFAATEMAEKVLGKPVVWFVSNRPFANGMADKGVIYLNWNTSRPLMALLGHEFTHVLRQTNPALYTQLAKALEPYMEGRALHNLRLNDARVRSGKPALAEDSATEELVADIMGDNWGTVGFWRDVTEGKPGLFQLVLKAVRDFLDRVLAGIGKTRPFGSDVYVSDVRAARNAVAQVMQEYFDAKDGKAAPAAAAIAESAAQALTDSPQFKRWFGDSKVNGDDGQPLVVYHGTARDFSTFSEAARGSATDAGFYGPGFYFTNRPESASAYAKPRASLAQIMRGEGETGGNVMPVYLRIERPFVTDEEVLDEQTLSRIKADGYDGIISTFDAANGYMEYVAFKPEQIKSAIGNRGTFDPASPDITLSASTDPFYSELSKQVDAIAMKAGDAQAWKQAFKGMLGKGVKADELEWTGINEWLDTQEGKIPKAAVQEFLQANGVKVTETTLGGAQRVEPLGRLWVVVGPNDEEIGPFSREDEARAVAEKDSLPVKYAAYQLPGGTNYREVLLTLPNVQRNDQPQPLDALPPDYEAIFDSQERPGQQWGVTEPGQMHARPWAGRHADPEAARAAALKKLNAERLAKWRDAAPEYKSSHWDQPNILAHIRLNDRTDSQGRRTLFVEEIQGDWPQAIRKQQVAINKAVDDDFEGIVERMKAAGVLEVNCD